MGYKLKYQLIDFEYVNDPLAYEIKYQGHALFIPLKGSASQERRWQKMRAETYKNSAMHFYRSAITNTIAQEGFKVQRFGFIVNPDRPDDSLLNARIAYYKDLISKTFDKLPREQLKNWEMKQNLPKYLQRLFSLLLKSAGVYVCLERTRN